MAQKGASHFWKAQKNRKPFKLGWGIDRVTLQKGKNKKGGKKRYGQSRG